MYLFDTDIVSNILKKRPSAPLLRRLAGLASELQFTSAITVGELVYGAYRSPRTDHFLEKLNSLVWPNVTIIPFDESAARIYGQLRATLERSGTTVSEPDLRIGSITLSRRFILVTGNIRHFARIPGLQFENWLE